MGRGIYEGSPRTERVQLETRSSDPSNPANGEAWLRTDLTGTDKVGEYRWFDGASINAVDVVTPGLTSAPVEEVLRVQTPNGKGVIKTAPRSDATYPEYSLQHAGSPLGLGYSAIPGSGGTHQWDSDEGTGTTLADSIGSLDGMINGATWTSGLGTGDTHLLYDATDDYTDLVGSASALSYYVNNGEGTLFAWTRIDTDMTAEGGIISNAPSSNLKTVALRYNGSSGFYQFAMGDGSGSYSVLMDGGGGNLIVGEWLPVAASLDGSDAYLYVGDGNGTLQQVGTDTVDGTAIGDLERDLFIGAENKQTGPDRTIDGSVDLAFADDRGWSQSELQQFVDDSIQLYQ